MQATRRLDSMNLGANAKRLIEEILKEMRESVSHTIVVACTALFLLLKVFDLLSILSWEQSVSVLGLSRTGALDRLWLFQFLTAPLLHGNITHLAFNMLSLWMLGPGVEAILGRRRYLAFSASCAVSAMAGCLFSARHSGVIFMGYSGVIFGLLVIQAVHFPTSRIAIFGFFPMSMRSAALLLGAFELYLTVSPEGSGIGHAGHLAGAVAALAFLAKDRWRRLGGRSLPPVRRRLRSSVQVHDPTRSRREVPWEL